MNLGLDYNGVISERREQYKELAEFFLKAGGKVYVISYWSPTIAITDFAQKLEGFPCTEKVMNTDEKTKAPEWKASLCKELEVDIFIDDKIIIASEVAKKGILSLVAT